MAQTWRIMGGLGNDNISHIPFNEEARNESIYEDFLQKSAKQSRIIAICASNIIVRDIMMKAKQLGMLDSGDYVFINVDLFRKCPQYGKCSVSALKASFFIITKAASIYFSFENITLQFQSSSTLVQSQG